MQYDWLPCSEELQPFYDGVEHFVASMLKDSVDQECDGKSIADPVVGYIHLTPMEAALLDTELFQRLRWIRQVGLAYLVYPTLGYSRFGLTLGAMGVAARVFDRLKQIYSGPPFHDPSILQEIESHETSFRLAVLFHDIGHCI